MAFVYFNGFLKSNWYKNRSVWFYITDGLRNSMNLSVVHLFENRKVCVPFARALLSLLTVIHLTPIYFIFPNNF